MLGPAKPETELLPLVSVIIPLFNREDLVEETLLSIASQSFRSFEVIVVDDGSSDGGPHRVEAFCATDPRFRLMHRNENKRGASVCRNLGLNQSLGKYILFLDSDDLLSVPCLERRLELLTASAEVDLVVGQGLIFRSFPGDQRTLWNVCDYAPEESTERFLDQDMPWANGAALWRKEALIAIGGWNPDLRCFQDWELHLRACIAALQIKVLPQPDFFIRRDDSAAQISSNHNSSHHVQSRLRAFDLIMSLLISRGMLNSRIKSAARGFLLRNHLDLHDAGCHLEAMTVLRSKSAEKLMTSLDRWLLAWIRKKGKSWRWNTRVKRVTGFLWKSMSHDSVHMKSTFMRTEWHGEIPSVAVTQNTRKTSCG
jgi:glycosyltransferase involved in cell wall biosynthesis